MNCQMKKSCGKWGRLVVPYQRIQRIWSLCHQSQSVRLSRSRIGSLHLMFRIYKMLHLLVFKRKARIQFFTLHARVKIYQWEKNIFFLFFKYPPYKLILVKEKDSVDKWYLGRIKLTQNHPSLRKDCNFTDHIAFTWKRWMPIYKVRTYTPRQTNRQGSWWVIFMGCASVWPWKLKPGVASTRHHLH